EPDPDRPHVLRLQRALLPYKAPFVPGIATRYRRLVAIVSSEPTAPSRLRSGEGRRGILSPVAGFLLKPTRGSSAANGLTPFGSGPSLSDHDHDRPPPLQIQWSRLVALGADHRKLVPKFSDDAPHKEGLKPACLALAPRAGEVS